MRSLDEPMKKRPRERSLRRQNERLADKLAAAKEKLARLEPGGSPQNALEVPSASVVEQVTESVACLRCGASVRADDHRALVLGARRLRVVTSVCIQCGAARVWYFRLGTPLAS